MLKYLNFIIICLFITVNVSGASNHLRALRVFEKLQDKTGEWNISIEIIPNGKSLILDKSNTIFVPEQIIELCYNRYLEREGDERLAFLLAHEIAHILNNDLDYDRILNPFNKKLTNEPVEIRKRKEINADLRAISIMNICGYSTQQFSNDKSNIIVDLYKYHGISNINKSIDNYPSAADRIKFINERKNTLNKFNKLYECGVYMLMLTDSKDNEAMLNLTVESFQSYQNYTSLNTPYLLNNIGLAYLKLAEANFSKDFIENRDTIDFTKFETGYIFNTEIQPVRGKIAEENSAIIERRQVDEVKYNMYIKKALNYFRESDKISNEEYLPAKLNEVILYGLNQNYSEAKTILDNLIKKQSDKLVGESMMAHYYNLAGIIEYCIGNKQKAADLFDKALIENPDFNIVNKNKKIIGIERGKSNHKKTKSGNDNSSGFVNAVYDTYGGINIVYEDKFSFGPKEVYDLQFTDSDSLKILTIQVKETCKKIEFVDMKNGGIKGNLVNIGDSKKVVLAKLSGKHYTYFSHGKSYFYYSKPGVIIVYNNNDAVEDIIIVNKVGFN